jgi:metal-dependent amidase/aminoacylase/carboxypeptidase family protein
MNNSEATAVVTIGTINGGNRGNIIPAKVEMTGTIRTLDPEMRKDVHARVILTVKMIAESYGATADVDVSLGYPETFNDPQLTARLACVLDRVSSGEKAIVVQTVMGAEDYSYFANKILGLFFGLGVAAHDALPGESASNHSPKFYVNDKALPVGVEALSNLAMEWLVDQQGVL